MNIFYKGGRGLRLLQSDQPNYHTKQTTKLKSLWPTVYSLQLKVKSLKPIAYSILLLNFMVFSVSDAWAQSAEPRTAEGQSSIRPLQIGDTIPEELWHLPMKVTDKNGTDKMISLDEHRGKLIVLDFWATWCASCIQGFPKAERLQEKYAEEIKVLLVNPAQSKDTPRRINDTFKKFKIKYGYSPRVDLMLQDTIFQQLFPHYALPHIVWIDQQGVFRAESEGSFLNDKIVSAALQGSFTAIDQKDDLRFKDKYPLITDIDKENRIASILLTGYVPGLGIRPQHVVEREGVMVYQIANHTLRYLYQIAYEDEFEGIFANRWIFTEPVAKDFIAHFKIFGKDGSKFCFEASFPTSFTEYQACKLLRDHLEYTFGVRAVRKSTLKEVYVLKATEVVTAFESNGGIPETQFDPSQGDMYVRNVSLRTLMNCFGDLLNKSFEVEVERDIKVDFLFPHDITDFNEKELIAYLQNNGIVAKRESKELEYVLFEKI